jgi:ZIP family zinc transporter
VTFALTVILGAIAGFTIYLGLPFARLQNSPRSLQAFLNALATGILLFLLWDVITKASEAINTALETARKGHPSDFVTLLVLFAGGFGVGLLSLVYFERHVLRRAAREARSGEVTPVHLALMIAAGMGCTI